MSGTTSKNQNIESTSPANGGEPVIPSDSVNLTEISRSLYIGAAGDISVEMGDGTNLTFIAVPAGMILPIQVKKVLATGTTATSIVAIW